MTNSIRPAPVPHCRARHARRARLLMRIVTPLLALTLALAGCTRVVSIGELDGLNRSLEARTIVIRDGVSIYSPLPLDSTVAFCQIVLSEERALRELLQMDVQNPITVQIQEMDDLFPVNVRVDGETVHVGVAPEQQGPRVLGYAGRDEAVIYVVPDREVEAQGRIQVVHVPAAHYRSVIRHELAHVFLYRLELPPDTWIQEGLAETIENFELVDGSLEVGTPTFSAAVERAARDTSLADVLAWRENGHRVERGLEVPNITHRQLSRSLVSFLLEQRRGEPFLEAVLAIGRLSQAEVLAQEPDWRVWLRQHCETGADE